MGDIAGCVGISKGNLTYHFCKKEDIIEGMLSKQEGDGFLEEIKSLSDLESALMDVRNVVEKYSFYFLYHAQLGQISESILQKQKIQYIKAHTVFLKGFYNLNRTGFFRDELYKGEYECLVDNIYMSAIYWKPYQSLREISTDSDDICRHAWKSIYPILTLKGKTELENVVRLF